LRVAERLIVEGSGRVIISYISSYSYLSDPSSFVVVRRHLLDGFDSIWIDCLNGDSRETGKRTPSGDPDPSVFSTAASYGIKLGTAVGMFVSRGSEKREPVVRYREFWGIRKREELLERLNPEPVGDKAEDLDQKRPRAAAGVKDMHARISKPVRETEFSAQRGIDALNHVTHDLGRRIPDAELLSQYRVIMLQERLIKILDRQPLIEDCKEGGPVNPV